MMPPLAAQELQLTGHARVQLTSAGHDALAAVRSCARHLLAGHAADAVQVTASHSGTPYQGAAPLPPGIRTAAAGVLAAYAHHAAAVAAAIIRQAGGCLPAGPDGGTAAGELEVTAWRPGIPAAFPIARHDDASAALVVAAVTRADIDLEADGTTVTVPGTWPWEVLVIPGRQLTLLSGGVITAASARTRSRGLPGVVAVTFTASAGPATPLAAGHSPEGAR